MILEPTVEVATDSFSAIPTELIVAVVGLIGTIIGVLVTLYVKKRVDQPQLIIDQYQEMVKGLNSDMADLKSRVSHLETKQDAYRTYVWTLREHISLDRGSPPPDWPVGLP